MVVYTPKVEYVPVVMFVEKVEPPVGVVVKVKVLVDVVPVLTNVEVGNIDVDVSVVTDVLKANWSPSMSVSVCEPIARSPAALWRTVRCSRIVASPRTGTAVSIARTVVVRSAFHVIFEPPRPLFPGCGPEATRAACAEQGRTALFTSPL